MINILPEPNTPEHAEAIARAAVPLLIAGGLNAVWVEADLVKVKDGRGVALLVQVRGLRGVADAVWRLLDRYEVP